MQGDPPPVYTVAQGAFGRNRFLHETFHMGYRQKPTHGVLVSIDHIGVRPNQIVQNLSAVDIDRYSFVPPATVITAERLERNARPVTLKPM